MTNSTDKLIGFSIAGLVITALGLAWLMANNETPVKKINVPVYSDIIPGHIIKYLPMEYVEEMVNGTLYYSVSFESADMEVAVEGYSSLHDALDAVRKIVMSK